MKKYNNKSGTSSSGGMGVFGIAQIVLLILKWTNLIDWPWRIVLVPLWIELGITAFVILLWLFANLFNNLHKNK